MKRAASGRDVWNTSIAVLVVFNLLSASEVVCGQIFSAPSKDATQIYMDASFLNGPQPTRACTFSGGCTPRVTRAMARGSAQKITEEVQKIAEEE